MGMIQRFREATRRRKAVMVKQEIANQLTLNPLCSDYENVFAQVTPLVNEMLLVRPFGVGKNGGKLAMARTPELTVLQSPNDQMGWIDFAGSMFRTWLTEDELNIHVHKENNRVIGYTILPPGSKVYQGNGNYYFQVKTDEGYETLTPDEVMTLMFSRSPKNLLQGVSPATTIRAWAQTQDLLAQYERAYIENGAIPATITFIRASSFSKFDTIRKEMEGHLKGAANHGKTVYVWRQFNNDTGESLDQVEVKTIQGNNSTLAIKELTDIINDYMNKAYGVSNFILGDDSSAKYDNAELSDYQFIKRRVYPALMAFWDQFQHELDRIVGGLGYAIQFEIELPDLTERQKVKAETNKVRNETLMAMIKSGARPADAVKALGLDDDWLGVARGFYQLTLAGLAVDKINILSNSHTPKTSFHISTPLKHDSSHEESHTVTSQLPASAKTDELPNMDDDERKIYDILISMAERIFAETPNIKTEEVIDEIADVLDRRAELGAIDGAEAISKLLNDKEVQASIVVDLENLEISKGLKDRIYDRTSELVDNYGSETRRIMDEVLADNEGKSAGEIRKALRQAMPTWQAERIARTETVYAFKSGRLDEDQKIADKYQLNVKLIWRSRHDPDTCPVCAAMDGEVVEVGEAFAHIRETADGVIAWEPSKWNDEGKIPQPHPNCRCYFDEILEEE